MAVCFSFVHICFDVFSFCWGCIVLLYIVGVRNEGRGRPDQPCLQLQNQYQTQTFCFAENNFRRPLLIDVSFELQSFSATIATTTKTRAVWYRLYIKDLFGELQLSCSSCWCCANLFENVNRMRRASWYRQPWFCRDSWEAILWGYVGCSFMMIFRRESYEDIWEAVLWG